MGQFEDLKMGQTDDDALPNVDPLVQRVTGGPFSNLQIK
jgi:hypothetical protein